MWSAERAARLGDGGPVFVCGPIGTGDTKPDVVLALHSVERNTVRGDVDMVHRGDELDSGLDIWERVVEDHLDLEHATVIVAVTTKEI